MMGDLGDKLIKHLPAPTTALLQVGAAFGAVLSGFPHEQFQRTLGRAFADKAKDADSAGWWTRRLLVALAQCIAETPWRILALIAFVAVFAAATVWRQEIGDWLSLTLRRRMSALVFALVSVGASCAFALLPWTALQGPLIIEGLADGHMNPSAFRDSGQATPSPEKVVASRLYAWVHGVSPDRPLKPRMAGVEANRCRCPKDTDFAQVERHELDAMWLIVASTLFLLCVSQLPGVLAGPFMDQYTRRSRWSEVVALSLALPVGVHMYQWYLGAKNLGFLQAAAFLRSDAKCAANQATALQREWPFCKPLLEVEESDPGFFVATNVWPAWQPFPSEAAFLVTPEEGERISWPLDLDKLGFEQGKLRLDFDPAGAAQRARQKLGSANVPKLTDAMIFDGQATGEMSLE